MKRRGVKITGIGFVTPAGIGKEAFYRGILEHRSHVAAITRFPPEAGPFVASEVKRFSVGDYFSDPTMKRMPRHTQFAMVAAKLALGDASLTLAAINGIERVVMIGASLMDSAVVNKSIDGVARKGPRFGLARVVFHAPVASISSSIAEVLGGGRTLSFQSACCSGIDAIGQAAAVVASGEAEIAVCGGTEAPIFYHPMLELRMADMSPATEELPEQLCRPFDLWRTTGVIGEGACVLILEPDSSPRPGYAFLRGYSFATDSSTAPGEGMSRAVQLCLANGKVRPSEVDSISAWGPGHKTIDAMEARVLREVFGDNLDSIPTFSIKGAIGNPFAAAGAIQAGCAALGFRYSFVPPTVNWQHPDPSCRLNLSARPRFGSNRLTLVNSHGISGTNAILLLERCP